ncbi:MAG: hypothetical protein WD208_08780 [Dehalococcoidia bacterium]
MVGSAIPKRWTFSLALVGLLSLFVALNTVVWSQPASAQGTLPTVLDDVQVPGSITLTAGQTITIQAVTRDATGAVNNNLEDLIFDWVSTAGNLTFPSGVVNNSEEAKSATLTAASSGTVTVSVSQDGGTAIDGVTTVTVREVPAPGTPTPVPQNPPGDPPVIPTPSDSGQSIGLITPADGGTVQGASDSNVEVRVPAGAVSDWMGATVKPVDRSSVPQPPAGSFRLGSQIFDFKFTDEAGVELDQIRLNRAATVCLPYNQADMQGAYQGIGGIALYRYNATTEQWVRLTSNVNPITGQVCASSRNFSLFGIGLTTAPPQSGTGLPATGDAVPGTGLLVVAGLMGAGLIGVGAVSLRRARRAGNSAV